MDKNIEVKTENTSRNFDKLQEFLEILQLSFKLPIFQSLKSVHNLAYFLVQIAKKSSSYTQNTFQISDNIF